MQQRAPYKYLDYYTFEDADLFFGREEETQKMVGEILSTRLLVLFSPSGSGKTSLINAGVRPALEKLGYETVYVRLDQDPIPSVQSAVAEKFGLPVAQSASNDLHAFLQQAICNNQHSVPSNQYSVISDQSVTSDQHPATSNQQQATVIFIDQFEEFFIVFENQPNLRQQFIEQVAKIKYDDQLPVFLVLSLREDYFANLHEFREAIPSIFQNNANIRLEDFTDEEARRAIIKPLEAVGAEMEGGEKGALVATLLRDLKNGKPGIEPIKLQIVCDTVWQKKPANATQITSDDYKASGGAKHILTNYVSRLLDDLPLRQQGLMAKIFAALKTPDETKRYRSFSDLRETLKIGAKRLQAALEQLAGLSLLRHEERAGDHWYEFKHDYLVREIVAWLQARRERIAKRRLYYGLSPGVALLLGLLVYLFVQYNSFYAGVLIPEHLAVQQAEIAVFRKLTNQSVITTGYWFEHTRNLQASKNLLDHLNLGFWKIQHWRWLPEQLNLYESGVLLYRLDSLQASLKALLDALKDSNEYVRSQAAAALGVLLKSEPESQLLNRLASNFSVERTAGAQALARQDSLSPALLNRIEQLRKNEKPWWVRLGAWEADALIQARLKSEAEARELLHKADSVFASYQYSVASGQWSVSSNQLLVASNQYRKAFDILKDIIRVDSAKTAYAKFQQARCEAKLKFNTALDGLEIAFTYNPAWRDSLQTEMAKPENDWQILAGNWYLREVLLKK